MSTSKYWFGKLFLTLENSQNTLVLSDTVWLDETYYSLMMRDRQVDERGNYFRGLSRNQICIGVDTDNKHTVCFVEGFGKSSQKSRYETFKDNIAEGFHLFTIKRKLTKNW